MVGERHFQIAHLSDLHCNGSKKWLDAFNQIETLLLQTHSESPDLIVITGDLVNIPRQKSYNLLCEKLVGLVKKLIVKKGGEPVHLVTVPGNHDFNPLLGNRFVFTKDESKYPLFIAQLHQKLSALHDDIQSTHDDEIRYIFQNHHVLLYAFDSNKVRWWTFARGIVESPPEEFAGISNKFRAFDEEVFEKSYKIALLHHHPIPQGKFNDVPWYKVWESSTTELGNAYTFLKCTAEHNIQLVLHGHEHRSGEMNVDFPDKKDSLRNTGYSISACGSSSWYKSKRREVKIYTIKDLMSCDVQSYQVEQRNTSGFQEDETRRRRLTRRTNRRAQLSANNCLFNKVFYNNVEKAAFKSKQVQIHPTGSADIEIMTYGVTPKNPSDPVSIQELIQSDYGRIVWGIHAFGERMSTLDDLSPSFAHWDNPLFESGNMPRAYKREAFCKRFPLECDYQWVEDNLSRIIYHHQSGYAVYRHQYDAMYPTNCDSLHASGREFSSIFVSHPVDELELIVRFSDSQCFPDVETFRVAVHSCIVTEDMAMPTSLDAFQRDHAEQNYLNDKKVSLRIRSGFSAVTLHVVNPLPNSLYTVSWEVPKDFSCYALAQPKEQAIYNELKNDFLGNGDGVLEEFAQKLQKKLQEMFEDESLRVFVFGYDEKESLLKIANNPEPELYKEFFPLCPGRGIVGAAFVRRKPVYWDRGTMGQRYHLEGAGELAYRVENTVTGLNPEVVLALPLAYPWNFQDCIPEEVLYLDDNNGDFASFFLELNWPFAAISIVSEDPNSNFILSRNSNTTRDELMEMIQDQYSDVNELAEELLLEFYGQWVTDQM